MYALCMQSERLQSLENEIGTIVSADTGFDLVRGLRRVDPLDARAVRRLARELASAGCAGLPGHG